MFPEALHQVQNQQAILYDFLEKNLRDFADSSYRVSDEIEVVTYVKEIQDDMELILDKLDVLFATYPWLKVTKEPTEKYEFKEDGYINSAIIQKQRTIFLDLDKVYNFPWFLISDFTFVSRLCNVVFYHDILTHRYRVEKDAKAFLIILIGFMFCATYGGNLIKNKYGICAQLQSPSIILMLEWMAKGNKKDVYSDWIWSVRMAIEDYKRFGIPIPNTVAGVEWY